MPEAALADMLDGMAPALIVERFEIRLAPDDSRRLALEDFCSILDLLAAAKCDATIECGEGAAASLDQHLKNLALLGTAAPGERRFDSVRFAPLYDAVTTRVFPGLGGDRMALKLTGKGDRLTPRDFLALARTIELPIARAEEATANIPAALRNAVHSIALPDIALDRKGGLTSIERVKGIVVERVGAFERVRGQA